MTFTGVGSIALLGSFFIFLFSDTSLEYDEKSCQDYSKSDSFCCTSVVSGANVLHHFDKDGRNQKQDAKLRKLEEHVRVTRICPTGFCVVRFHISDSGSAVLAIFFRLMVFSA